MTTNNNPIRSSSISTKQNPIPPCIVTALSKPQDKLYILHLEKDLINFIRNSILGNIKQPEYIIQAQYLKNSYYRLLCHQLCQYYCLQHWNTPFNEIIVTPTLNFDYKQYLDEELFVKISSVSHKYKTESEPVQHEPIQREPVKKLLVRKPIDAPSTPVDDDEKKLDFVNEVQDVDIEAKRALYMKLREEIFDNNDEEEEDEEEDEEKHHDADVVDNI